RPHARGPRTLPQRNGDRRLLHHPTRRRDNPLPERARPRDPAHLPPAPGWFPTSHRIKAPLDDGLGQQKVWGYGARRGRDGHGLPFIAPSRNTVGYLKLLTRLDAALLLRLTPFLRTTCLRLSPEG